MQNYIIRLASRDISSFSPLRERETGKQTSPVSSGLLKTGKKQKKLVKASDIQSDAVGAAPYGGNDPPWPERSFRVSFFRRRFKNHILLIIIRIKKYRTRPKSDKRWGQDNEAGNDGK